MNDEPTQKRYDDMLQTAFGEALRPYLDNPDITEIMVNPDGQLHIEHIKTGKKATDIRLPTEQVSNIIQLIAASHQHLANAQHPEVATELPGSGARFQAWLPPIATGPTFTLRKRAQRIFTLDDYVKQGILNPQQKAYLVHAIQTRKNILISGGTNSGKTTLANALLDTLSESNDRIIVLEDLPELQMNANDVVTLRTRNAVDMRQLVKSAMRMRPDRIIIGEVRDGAALELLKAWNTGHPGGLCTLHANSAEETPERLVDLLQEALPVVPYNLIVRAVDVIISMGRSAEGQREITAISKLTAYENNRFVLVPFNEDS